MSSRYGTYLALLLLSTGWASSAQAQPVCDTGRLERAASSYEFGWFDETFDELDPCIPDGFSEKDQRLTAFELMALSYVATDSTDDAREWVRRILHLEPSYQPDLQVENLVYRDMVRDLKPRWYTWLWKGNEWYKWAGRGALASGVVMVPILAQTDEEPDLPEPPVGPQ